MNKNIEKIGSIVDKAVEKYSTLDVFRAGVQLIPYIGGPIDTILSGRASRIQFERFEQFAYELRMRLEVVEAISADVQGDEFADFVLTVLENVWRARTAEKRRSFAVVVSKQIITARSWDDADMAVRLVAELESIHIDVLLAVLSVSHAVADTNGMKIVAFDIESADGLLANFSQSLKAKMDGRYSDVALRLACSELVARGLLHDAGVGKWNAQAMKFFVTTDLAVWFSEWLAED